VQKWLPLLLSVVTRLSLSPAASLSVFLSVTPEVSFLSPVVFESLSPHQVATKRNKTRDTNMNFK
jgi:hypothetical protein